MSEEMTEREKEQVRPDWTGECDNCGSSPIVPFTGLCGPCTYGQADTVAGQWWDSVNDQPADCLFD